MAIRNIRVIGDEILTKKAKEVKEMTQLIRKYVKEGRSTPGAEVANDTENDWKQVNIFMQ